MFLFLRLTFILFICESCEIFSKNFTLYLKDKLLSGYYCQRGVENRIGCVSFCVDDSFCFRVAYHASRQMCYLYDELPKCNIDTPVIDYGMETFLPKDAFIQNIALNKPASMSSYVTRHRPCVGVDGLLNEYAHTLEAEIEWFCVDLEKIYNFQSIAVYNRIVGHPDAIIRIKGFELRLSDTGQCNLETFNGARTCYKDTEPSVLEVYNITSCNQPNISFSSRFIFISPKSGVILNFREIVVYERIV